MRLNIDDTLCAHNTGILSALLVCTLARMELFSPPTDFYLLLAGGVGGESILSEGGCAVDII